VVGYSLLIVLNLIAPVVQEHWSLNARYIFSRFGVAFLTNLTSWAYPIVCACVLDSVHSLIAHWLPANERPKAKVYPLEVRFNARSRPSRMKRRQWRAVVSLLC